MAFEFPQKVLFKHCDPAGIIFFPRYFEMINDCAEAFFASEINWPFEELLKTGGLPTAEISTRFKAPSRHGETLMLKLRIERLGRSSIDIATTATCGEEVRLISRSTLVRVGSNGRPEGWPDDVRSKLQEIMKGHHVN
jgi:4-hydroxybenzoyl-CoA thioesterase